jgi:hypothetical protein
MIYVEHGLACSDCVIAIANDDYSGMSDIQAELTRDGIDRIGRYLIVQEEYGFSWRGCDVCGVQLGGDKHVVGYLQEVEVA